ncbi:DMT family transporter [Ideonella sp. DXS22W]|uniref:DMT family transporter n=1 Tax=Pseudaquabacterium inlustre TaxID=2984192 RepID=A0ABU9CLV6_9BURK
MKSRDLTDLLLLAAIWGSSFLFMRMAVPAFGPVPLAFVRVLGAALMLLPLLLWRGEWAALRSRFKPMLVLGLTNSGLPFLCFGYAALTLPAGLAAIFNAATPMATALIAWAWLGDPLSRPRAIGLLIGFAGVAGLALNKSLASGALHGLQLNLPVALAIAACLAGTLMYGHAASFTRRYMTGTPSMVLATGTQAAAALALALPAALTWPAVNPAPQHWAMALALAALCSALAYILYFRLLQRIGPTSAASVTFLVPVFASAWGAVVLGEAITPAMLLGGAVILGGTSLVLGLWPRSARSA